MAAQAAISMGKTIAYEIAQAIDGKLAHLIALNGGETAVDTTPDTYTPERLREIEELGFDPAFDREGLRRLKAMT